MTTTSTASAFDRRRFMAFLGGFGVAGLAADHLWAAITESAITADDVDHAARIAGLEFVEDERDLMVEGINELREDYVAIRTVPLDNSISPTSRRNPVRHAG